MGILDKLFGSGKQDQKITYTKALNSNDFPYDDGFRLAWRFSCPVAGITHVIYTRKDLVCEGFDFDCYCCGSHIDVFFAGSVATITTTVWADQERAKRAAANARRSRRVEF